MHLLVLGGTRFVGRAIVEAALAAGWDVTTFNRGLSGTDVPGVRIMRGDRTQAGDLPKLRAVGVSWDAVVDTSGFVPRDVLSACLQLESVARQYVFMSTVSVYRGWPIEPLSESSEVLYCPPDAGPDYGQDVENGPTRYGYQKSGCELAVMTMFGPERTTVLRPGVVLGPGEYVGRLPWWLGRVAQGGRVLAPGSPQRTIQPIDVRDLADFVIHSVREGVSGTFNVTAPRNSETFNDLLEACGQATGTRAEFVWIPDQELLASGVRQWSEMPLWRVFEGVWQVDSAKAAVHGLTSREISDTAEATWAWMRDSGVQFADERAAEIGISRQREEEVLARFFGQS